jgi:hypothetical protein
VTGGQFTNDARSTSSEQLDWGDTVFNSNWRLDVIWDDQPEIDIIIWSKGLHSYHASQEHGTKDLLGRGDEG